MTGSLVPSDNDTSGITVLLDISKLRKKICSWVGDAAG